MTLYATDLDGTLLRPDTSIADDTVATLNSLAAQGVLFTYATARSFSSAYPLVKKLDLSCPAVTFNGVFIIDPATGEHIIENVFNEDSFAKAKRFFVEHRLAPLVYSYIDGKERVSYLADRLCEVNTYVDSRKNDKRLRAVSDYDELFEGRVFYFTLLNPTIGLETLDEMFSAKNGFAHNYQVDTYIENEMWYEIFAAEASKANAVMQVKRLVNADRTVCFGDNTNDISMIRCADIGVAVSNASDDLKRAADVIIGSNSSGAVAEYIQRLERKPADRFTEALNAAQTRIRGMHGSVGTQNEKLIHAALKNYYAPCSDEQEIKIGKYFADAVSADGIFEIQTRALKSLTEKLKVFLEAGCVTIVHPVEALTRTVYINEETGEVIKEGAWRRVNPRVKIFAELYSIREFLCNERLTIILAKLKVEKRVPFCGNALPDLRNRKARQKLNIQKIPLALMDEVRLECRADYLQFLPEGLPAEFTAKELRKAARDGEKSLRTEVLRTVGIIEQTGKRGRSYLYRVSNNYQQTGEENG
ncbi:MAG: HAD family hydrolase [Oscillospiraceae bacterium]